MTAKIITAPKYNNRALRPHEVKRYEELVILHEKLYGSKYRSWGVIPSTGETLMDIACSTKRYQDIYKWYQEKREKKLKKKEAEEEKKTIMAEDIEPPILDWLKSSFEKNKDQVKEKEKVIQVEDSVIESDLLAIKAEEIIEEALELMKSRNKRYWDSWKVLTVQSLANLCEMKLHRIARLGEAEAKTADELIDVLNYCIFGLIKLKKKTK